MVAVRVMGNDTAVRCRPALSSTMFLQYRCIYRICNLLADSLISLEEKCVKGITVNPEKMDENTPFVATYLITISVMRMLLRLQRRLLCEQFDCVKQGTSLGLFTAGKYGAWIDLMA